MAERRQRMLCLQVSIWNGDFRCNWYICGLSSTNCSCSKSTKPRWCSTIPMCKMTDSFALWSCYELAEIAEIWSSCACGSVRLWSVRLLAVKLLRKMTLLSSSLSSLSLSMLCLSMLGDRRLFDLKGVSCGYFGDWSVFTGPRPTLVNSPSSSLLKFFRIKVAFFLLLSSCCLCRWSVYSWLWASFFCLLIFYWLSLLIMDKSVRRPTTSVLGDLRVFEDYLLTFYWLLFSWSRSWSWSGAGTLLPFLSLALKWLSVLSLI